MHNFAIVISTYNPQERIFSRTLKALSRLDLPSDTKVECVIVDNNSTIPLKDLPYVRDFLTSNKWARVIVEKRQGTSFARLCGLKATKSPIVIFFDDDNAPAPDFLTAVRHCLQVYPDIALFGPGTIDVEFVDPVPKWVARYARPWFQEKNLAKAEYGCVRGWTQLHPTTTGMVAHRAAIQLWAEAFVDGTITNADRVGSNLMAAGDAQMVWTVVKAGLNVGSLPELKIQHLIPAKRIKPDYLVRLCYSSGISYYPSLVEIFPDEKDNVNNFLLSKQYLFKRLLSPVAYGLKHRDFRYVLFIDIPHFLGEVAGMCKVTGQNEPFLLKLLTNIWQLFYRLT